jgi:argininosuccinate lyase
VQFRSENIALADELYAAERANELVVKKGLPFRDAYRKIAETLAKKKK